jgi:hypothetical protein
MVDAEASLNSIECVSDGLRLVIQIEASEVNQVFNSVVAASEAGFVKKVRAFQKAAAEHISFICDAIPKLEPDLAQQCREFRDRFLAGSCRC